MQIIFIPFNIYLRTGLNQLNGCGGLHRTQLDGRILAYSTVSIADGVYFRSTPNHCLANDARC